MNEPFRQRGGADPHGGGGREPGGPGTRGGGGGGGRPVRAGGMCELPGAARPPYPGRVRRWPVGGPEHDDPGSRSATPRARAAVPAPARRERRLASTPSLGPSQCGGAGWDLAPPAGAGLATAGEGRVVPPIPGGAVRELTGGCATPCARERSDGGAGQVGRVRGAQLPSCPVPLGRVASACPSVPGGGAEVRPGGGRSAAVADAGDVADLVDALVVDLPDGRGPWSWYLGLGFQQVSGDLAAVGDELAQRCRIDPARCVHTVDGRQRDRPFPALLVSNIARGCPLTGFHSAGWGAGCRT